MYYHNRNRYNQNSRRPARRIKSFDPSHLVGAAVPPAGNVEEYLIVNSFKDFGLSPVLEGNILRRYTAPTPIQDRAIPLILKGGDVIGIANTGTGKTAAFLIPLIEAVAKNRNKKVLVVTPTRELAEQIKQEFVEFARGLGIYAALVIGGVSISNQRYELQRNPNFVIATPGRLKDLISQRAVNLGSFNTIVLDEVDQMVDIGFIEHIRYFISLLPAARQSLFFSATVDGKTGEILSSFVRNAVTVSVKKNDTLANIRQEVVRVADLNRKIEMLHDLLIKREFEKVLIFGRTKWGIQKLSRELVSRGFKADAIHGNKTQFQRRRTLDNFKRNRIQILLATDVASRGLDIDNVTHVINYDLPESYESYIHRIGRTGRAEKSGMAITFV